MPSWIILVPVALGVLAIVGAVGAGLLSRRRINRLPPEQRRIAMAKAQSNYDMLRFGSINGALVCPHCQQRGHVRTMAVKRKAGISGAKATGALLTGGVSVLATGLSRKQSVTQARCDACTSIWAF